VVDPTPPVRIVVVVAVVVVLTGGAVVAGAVAVVVGLAVVVVAGRLVVLVVAGRLNVKLAPGGRSFTALLTALSMVVGADVDGVLTANQRAPKPRNRTAITAVERRILTRLESGRRKAVVIAVGFMGSWSARARPTSESVSAPAGGR
jgi:hypothetical protein